MRQTQNVLSDAKVLCVQMATATIGSVERYAAGEIVQNMLEEIVSLANTEVGGRYIFAGSKTDAIPFSQDGTYSGDNNDFSIKIGKDVLLEVGSDGEEVFGGIFNALSVLKNALETNDINGIGASMNSLNDHFDHFTTKISGVGSKMIRMDIRENILQDLNILNVERLSKMEDADITDAIINLKSMEIGYQAALASSTKVMNLSLVNYM